MEENQGHQEKYSKAIKKATQSGRAEFLDWFDKAEDDHASMMSGYWDLAIHILTPTVCRHMQTPQEKVALEIGYGGGRILNAACSYFKEVIGIDVHDEGRFVEEILSSLSKTNFQLLRTAGSNIDISSDHVDFVYSFIVLQHLPSFATLQSYLQEICRVLKPGGIAQLYFGSFSKLTVVQRLRCLPRGYSEMTDAPVNHTSLVVSSYRMKSLCHSIGLKVLETGRSYKAVPDGFPDQRGGQRYITLRKQEV